MENPLLDILDGMRPALFQTALLALAYAVVGCASLQLAAPPVYASPVFPSAGIALGTLLLFGRRLWPGVFFGSLLVQLYVIQRSELTVDTSWTVLLAPLGATVQAWAGALWANRWIGQHSALDSPAPILALLAVVIPVSALINSSFITPWLIASGAISASDAVFTWWNWWLGDALGTLLIVPAMFALFGRPRENWQSRRLGILIPMSIAVTLILIAFLQVRNWELLRINSELDRETSYIADTVRKRLEVQVDMMMSIERFISTNPRVDRQGFADFVLPWLARYPGTQNFGWSPLVHHAQRAAFERAQRKETGHDFQILSRDEGGTTFRGPEQDFYLPITYVEPLAHNLSVLGLNPLYFPATADAVRATTDSGAPAASGGFRLVQEKGEQRGVVVYLAVHDARPGSSAPPALRGVISGVFRMDDSLSSALDIARQAGLELCLLDTTARAGNQRLSGPTGCDTQHWLSSNLHRTVALEYAGKQWALNLRPGPDYIFNARNWTAWLSPTIAIMSSLLLSAFVLITTGNTRRIALLVDNRTAELAETSSRLREQQQALVEAQQLARMGSWQTIGATLSHPVENTSIQVSDNLLTLLEHPPGSLNTLLQLIASVTPASQERLVTVLRELASRDANRRLDCNPRHEPGNTLQFEIEGVSHDGQGRRLRGTVIDVSREREAAAHIHHLAHYDLLTSLPNRSAWLEHARKRLELARRSNERLAILFLDLDNFKTVNDSLGHSFGDLYLAEIACHLSGQLRSEDLLARLGGDEFVALLPAIGNPDQPGKVAGKLVASLAHPMQIDGHDINPSVSIGIALYPEDGEDVETLLKHADTAMYGAKSAGKNTFRYFVPEMNARVKRRLLLENALRRALDEGGLVLHYQPQVCARSRRLLGCEALLRWRHHELGNVPPVEFIPVAEETGLIHRIGEFVLREACLQQSLWADSPLAGITVSLNISPIQFRQGDFVGRVQRALEETGANPTLIELEITESALLDPSAELDRTLAQLRELGLHLALDDFGTGYSSLAYLKRLPLTRLKIDKSFVTDLPHGAGDVAVATATLALGHDLGLTVVAEGVETPEQADYLTLRGCDLLQGFMFSHPMSACDFAQWARQQRSSHSQMPDITSA